MAKLHELIAAEKHTKTRSYAVISELYKAVQKPQLFSGQVRTYQKKDDAGEDLPQEHQHVQAKLTELLDYLRAAHSTIIDLTAQKDLTNQKAMASVIIDGQVLLPELPVTTLLMLEKQLTDLHTFVKALPELDASEQWTYDTDAGLCRSAPVRTHRTRKMQKAIVLYDATDKHPAQTQLITEDEIVGYWSTQKVSTAIPKMRKQQMLTRIDMVLCGVKEARERANGIDAAPKQSIADKIFSYVMKE